jgi:hypothetical protein
MVMSRFATVGFVFGLAFVGAAYGAPKCGDSINLNGGPVNLTANLGPCPGSGLVIVGSGTLKLNGFAIKGVTGSTPSSGAGLYLLNATNVTIDGIGPDGTLGTISNFATGVAVRPGDSGIVIQNLTLRNNTNGVNVDSAGDVHIRDNQILPGSGGNNAEVGVFVTSSIGVKIKSNLIRGQSTAGVEADHSLDVTVDLNAIHKNHDGFASAAAGELGLLVLGNDLSGNYQDGIRISGTGGLPYTVAVEGNDVSNSGRDGLGLFGGPLITYRAEDNSMGVGPGNAGGGQYGIHVGAGWSIIQNTSYRSAMKDIFWENQPGSGTCLSNNLYGTFATSVPAAMPVCP